MACDSNTWLLLGQLTTAVVVATATGYFAYQQVKTAKDKLRLDQFDKRYPVFVAAREFLGTAIAKTEVSLEDTKKFYEGSIGAPFLFNDELAKYLNDLQTRADNAAYFYRDLELSQGEEDHAAAAEKFKRERKWLRDQYNELEDRFRPFLSLDRNR